MFQANRGSRSSTPSRRRRLLGYVVVAVTLLCASVGSAFADAKGTSPEQAPPSQRGAAYQGPGVRGQMRSTRNHERWAAATRKADRRAGHVRNHGKGN